MYSTEISGLKKCGSFFRARCSIKNGFRHQVRCHLAWCGFPVIYDALYNSAFRSSPDSYQKEHAGISGMQFFADGLEFPDLYSLKTYRFYAEAFSGELS